MEILSLKELGILDFIQEHIRCDFLDWFFPTITKLGDSGIFWILLAVIFLFSFISFLLIRENKGCGPSFY